MKQIFIRYQKEAKYLTKIILCHVVLNDVEVHASSYAVVRADEIRSNSASHIKYPKQFFGITKLNTRLLSQMIGNMMKLS